MDTRGVSSPSFGRLRNCGAVNQHAVLFSRRDAAVVQICKRFSGGLARRLHYSALGLILLYLLSEDGV